LFEIHESSKKSDIARLDVVARRVRALPCGFTLPRLDAIRSVDSLPKKNFTEPSGFWRGSAESSTALIGKTYLSSRE
jgi:hypothetical protein